MVLRVSVAGHIGVGKSTTAAQLSKELDLPLVPEPFSENDYWVDFYKDKERYALPTQLSFMGQRIQHHQEIHRDPEFAEGMVQDRSAFEDMVFANRMHKAGDMSDRDMKLYRMFFDIFAEAHGEEVPHVIVFLQATTDTVVERIRMRGRKEEQSIDAKYIESFVQHYDAFIKDMSARTRVIVVDWNASRTPNQISDAVRKIVASVRDEQAPTKGRVDLTV